MLAAFLNVFAWMGSAFILYAYARQTKTRYYKSLNIVGSIGLGAQCAYHGLYAQLLTNSIWTIIGLRSLLVRNAPPPPENAGEPRDTPRT